MAKTLVIPVGDQHINSTVALAPRSVERDDGGTWRASRQQRALLECWDDFWEKVDQTEADQKILVNNGDLGELDTQRRSWQLITRNPATIKRTILKVYEPVIDIVDRAIVTRGTSAHVGKSAWIEEWFADDLDITVRNDKIASWWHFRGKLGGVPFDISHHASMGSLPWTEKNAGNKIAAKVLWRYLVEMKQPAPKVVLRSHNHRYSTSGDNFEGTEAFCLPCWSLMTEYAYRTGRENDRPDIGGMIFECENGEYTRRKIVYEFPQAKRIWKLSL